MDILLQIKKHYNIPHNVYVESITLPLLCILQLSLEYPQMNLKDDRDIIKWRTNNKPSASIKKSMKNHIKNNFDIYKNDRYKYQNGHRIIFLCNEESKHSYYVIVDINKNNEIEFVRSISTKELVHLIPVPFISYYIRKELDRFKDKLFDECYIDE